MRAVRTLASALLLLAPLAFAQTGFQTETYPAPNDSHLLTPDLNRDGKPDLLMFGGPLTVELNNGSGGFGTALPVAGGASADYAAVADFNKDGLPDIATCTHGSSTYSSTVAIYLNHGGGSFVPSFTATIPYHCSNVMAGDVNRDGKADLVVAGYSYSNSASAYTSVLLTYFGNGAGKLATPITQQISVAAQHNSYFSYCFLGSGVGANFSGTGRFDLILMGDCQADPTNAGTLYYATSNTSGHYTLSEITEDVRGYDYNLPYVADVDGNGSPDVVLIDYQFGPHGSWNNNLDFLVNKGGGVFALKQIFNENSYAASYNNAVYSGAAGDFNGDQIYDAVAGFTQSPSPCCTPDTPGLVVLNGQGRFQYSESQRWTLGGYPYATMAADFNKDGRPDIATLTYNQNTQVNQLQVYLNKGGVTTPCTAPSSPGVHVCAPLPNQTYSSPVTVIATGKGASGSVNHLELWIDGKKIGSYPGATMDAKVNLSTGFHAITVVEVDSKGAYIKSTPVDITVK